MHVLLVTTWETPCGIAEHSAQLVEAVRAADPRITFTPHTDLHPHSVTAVGRPDVLHLNYHAALHSQWTPEAIREAQAQGWKVLVTYHDTGVPNSDQCKRICEAADAFVVHEPYDDLPPGGTYLRQGIPPLLDPYPAGRWRPTVGTAGFPFPWKNYELLCEAAALAGWGVRILAPGATRQQLNAWDDKNPHVRVTDSFQPRAEVVRTLAQCDATAFLYSCANTGTSAAIRQGIGALKPVLAFECRQFRDLYLDPVGRMAIRWIHDGSPEGIAEALSQVPIQRVDPKVVRLAAQDSWTTVGQRYAEIYRSLR